MNESKIYRRMGFHFAQGVMSSIALLLLIFLVIGWLTDQLGWSTFDSSDQAPSHSGMKVKTDALTGCEYLDASSLTPRLGVDGKQICVPTK